MAAGASLAAIVASLHGRAGKTLLARALADYFILSGGNPCLFDTDPVERGLHALFPHAARVVDLAVVRDQMLLFDTLAAPSPEMRVVDVTHRALTKFFELLRDTDFIFEARLQRIIPVIFYIPDRKADSFEAGVVLRNNFPGCPFFVVNNGFFQPKRHVRQSSAYKTLKAHKSWFTMPRLTEDVIDALEDRDLSIGDLMRQPMSSDGEVPAPDGLVADMRIELRDWAFQMFREIHRVTARLTSDHAPSDAVAGSPWLADLEDWGPAVDLSGPSNLGRLQTMLHRILSKPL